MTNRTCPLCSGPSSNGYICPSCVNNPSPTVNLSAPEAFDAAPGSGLMSALCMRLMARNEEMAVKVVRFYAIAWDLLVAGDPKPWMIDEWKEAKRQLENEAAPSLAPNIVLDETL